MYNPTNVRFLGLSSNKLHRKTAQTLGDEQDKLHVTYSDKNGKEIKPY